MPGFGQSDHKTLLRVEVAALSAHLDYPRPQFLVSSHCGIALFQGYPTEG